MAKDTNDYTLVDAYADLTEGREVNENNNSNIFGQLDRAWRQSRDESAKRKIASRLGFSYALHEQGPRARTR